MLFSATRRKTFYLSLGILLSNLMCFSQESRGTILGRVIDSTGAVVVGTRVQATNVATNSGASSTTNEHGNYEIPYLLPGIYRVSVERAGFKKGIRDQIELRVNDRLALDFTLKIGDVADSVVVTGETPLLESTAASLGMVMDQRRVSELPIVGGNPIYLVVSRRELRATPGVATDTTRTIQERGPP